MADYVKHTQGKSSLFLIPIKEEDEHTIYLDFSKLAKTALSKDKEEKHKPERGPSFGFEVHRATEYAEYLRDCDITIHNFHRFNTRGGYSLFIENV